MQLDYNFEKSLRPNENKRHKKWVSYFHRTATTIYPCYVPILGDLTGAGRERLTHRKNRNFISLLALF
jgi:hypothetical protein